MFLFLSFTQALDVGLAAPISDKEAVTMLLDTLTQEADANPKVRQFSNVQ